MRVSTSGTQNIFLNNMSDLQTLLNKKQQELATGKRIQRASDDPIASQTITLVKQEIAAQQRYLANKDSAERHLGIEDNAISEYSTIIQRIRELTVQSANYATLTSQDRQAIAAELQQQLDGLESVANLKDADGQYIFSGFQSNSQTYTQNSAGRYVFNGDQGQRFAQVGSSTQIATSDSAQIVFQQIPAVSGSFITAEATTNTGDGIVNLGKITDLTAWQASVATNESYTLTMNASGTTYTVTADSTGLAVAGLSNITYTSGANIAVAGVTFTLSGSPHPSDSFSLKPASQQSVFATIQHLITAVQTETDADRYTFATDSALSNFDAVLDRATQIRTEIGGRLNVMDQQYSMNSDFILAGQQVLSKNEDVDYAEAISQVDSMSIALQAAQQIYVKTKGLSLFNFLS